MIAPLWNMYGIGDGRSLIASLYLPHPHRPHTCPPKPTRPPYLCKRVFRTSDLGLYFEITWASIALGSWRDLGGCLRELRNCERPHRSRWRRAGGDVIRFGGRGAACMGGLGDGEAKEEGNNPCTTRSQSAVPVVDFMRMQPSKPPPLGAPDSRG